MQGLLERIEREVAPKRTRHPPADDGAGEHVDDESHVRKAHPGRHVRDVGDPKLIRSRRDERALDEVRGASR